MLTNGWDLTTVESFIHNKVEENLTLDYKAADSLQSTPEKKKELAKDVSAMANSAGGTLIYGIREYQDNAQKHLPEKLDPVLRTNISKEWIEQVINSHIQPKIEGILITAVPVDEAKGTVVYVVSIPQSNTAHQASDKKYYKRYNFASIAMDDYEIRDIMGRLKHPDMSLQFLLEKQKVMERETCLWGTRLQPSLVEKSDSKYSFQFQLKVAIRNKGKVLANYVNYYLEIPSGIVHSKEDLLDSSHRSNYKEFYGENTIRDILGIKQAIPGQEPLFDYGPSRYDPILPGTRSRFEKIRLADNLPLDDQLLHWKIFADNAQVKTGSISVLELQAYLKENWK